MVSVIIPVYNAEGYIEKLLRSFSMQSFSDYEVLCVDDGSTDNTKDIMAAFSKQDPRFKLIPKEHSGAGPARNEGLEHACGKYVMFLDADDDYNNDLLNEMVSGAEKNEADEVFCLYSEYNYRTHIRSSGLGFDRRTFPDRVPVVTSEIPDLYLHTPWGVTNTLFRKDIIDRYHLKFSATQVANDVFFINAYTSVSRIAVGIERELLNVRKFISKQSLTSTRWMHTEDAITALIELYTWLCENDLYKRYRNAYLKLFFTSIQYNGSFPLNPKYIDSLTEVICTSEIFAEMSDDEFYNSFWKTLDAGSLQKKIGKMKDNKDSLEDDAQSLSNLLLTVISVEELALKRHGRMLAPPHTD